MSKNILQRIIAFSSFEKQWSYSSKLQDFVEGIDLSQKNETLSYINLIKLLVFFSMRIITASTCTILYCASLIYFYSSSLMKYGKTAHESNEFIDFFDDHCFKDLSLKPDAAFIHALQCHHFREYVRNDKIDLEIGIDNGESSAYYFRDKVIEIGIEYYLPAVIGGKYPHVQNVYSMDIFSMAFFDNSKRTVTAVHVLDHFTDLKNALTEVNRIMVPGGHFYFSALTDNYYKTNPIYQLLNRFTPNLANGFREKTSNLWRHYNTLSLQEWEKALSECGFEMEDYDFFVCGESQRIWHYLFWLSSLGGVYIFYLLQKLGIYHVFPSLKRLNKTIGVQIFYPLFEQELKHKQNEGINVIIKARKTGTEPLYIKNTDDLKCLDCTGTLKKGADSYTCTSCGAIYPCIHGIPFINRLARKKDT